MEELGCSLHAANGWGQPLDRFMRRRKRLPHAMPCSNAPANNAGVPGIRPAMPSGQACALHSTLVTTPAQQPISLQTGPVLQAYYRFGPFDADPSKPRRLIPRAPDGPPLLLLSGLGEQGCAGCRAWPDCDGA